MTSFNKRIITTSNTVDFQCEMCGICCKSGWKIIIEDRICHKLNLLSKKDDFLKKNIKIDKIDNQTLFNRDGCGLLLPDNQCYLHKVYGQSSMGSVCSRYPRLYIKSPRGIEVGLSYSCPATLKLLTKKNRVVEDTNNILLSRLSTQVKTVSVDRNRLDVEDLIYSEYEDKPNNLNDFIFNLNKNLLTNRCLSIDVFNSDNQASQKKLLKHAIALLNDRTPNLKKLLLNAVDQELPDSSNYSIFEMKNGDIISNYLLNHVFTRTLYYLRNSSDDNLVFILFIKCVIKFIMMSNSLNNNDTELSYLLEIIQTIEKELISNGKLCAKFVMELIDWY